jgi:hypothetical protein
VLRDALEPHVSAGDPPGLAARRARRIGWDGGSGCSWRTDLDSGVTAILLTQRSMTSPAAPPIYLDFWRAAFGD